MQRRGRWLALAMLVAGVVGALGWRAAIRWHPDDAAYPFQGIDIGAAQGAVAWPSVATQGVRFAYLRATVGAIGDGQPQD